MLCEQDIAQGFKDRRLRKPVDVVIDMKIPVLFIAPALGQTPKPVVSTPNPQPVVVEVKPPLNRSLMMVIKMGHYFCQYGNSRELTDDDYRNNVQFVRDQMDLDRDYQIEEDEPLNYADDYGNIPKPPTRRQITVI